MRLGRLAVLACALLPWHRGVAAEIKLATWDLGWLTARPAGDPALPDRIAPKRPEDLARLARYAVALEADIVAFQGVDGAEVAERVFDAGDYAVLVTGDTVLQRTGFAVRRSLRVERHPDLAGLDPYPDATFRLRSGADVTVTAPGGAQLRLLSVHLKSGCRDDPLERPTQEMPAQNQPDKPACATLARQAGVLADWIAARATAGEAFVVLGDFGRVMEGADPFLATLAAAAPLLRATEHRASPCWGGMDFVDHILLGGAARGWLEPGTLRVMAYRETEPAWRARLSDHCPVSVRLRLPDPAPP